MIKLLVNGPLTGQEVVEVDETGGYFDANHVIWDERINGPLPEITLGGMIRDGDGLRFDQNIFDADALLKRTGTIAAYNAPILAALERIDSKSIRALREGDQVRIATLEAEAAALRVQLVKE